MPYKLHPNAFAAVSRLPAPERYEHFINRAADFSEVWTLKGPAGYATMADDQGRKGVPLWPHPDFAAALATDDWSAHQPHPIPLPNLLDKWLPGMARDGLLALIFPTPAGRGVPIAPLRLQQDLIAERGQLLNPDDDEDDDATT
jgi:hypothetical protein